MNHRIISQTTFSGLITLLLPFLAATPCDAQRNTVLQQAGVDMEMLFIELPESLALELVPNLQKESEAKQALTRIEKLIAAQKATVWGWITLTTKSGQRAVTEQVTEFRYATEFDPPRVNFMPNHQIAQPVKPQPMVDVTAFDAAPTAFETRNCGVTFECEPVIGPDGETIDLNLVPQHVRFLGFKKTIIEKQPAGTKLIVEQPEFHTLKVTTSLTMKSGDVRLLGVFKAPQSADRMELFILRATIRTLRLPKPANAGSDVPGPQRGAP